MTSATAFAGIILFGRVVGDESGSVSAAIRCFDAGAIPPEIVIEGPANDRNGIELFE